MLGHHKGCTSRRRGLRIETLEPRILLNGGPAPDIYEPNDTSGTATDLGLLQGPGSPTELTGVTIDDPLTSDWYRFSMGDTGAAGQYIGIDFSHAQGDLDLYVYDYGLNPVGSSTSATDNEQVSLNGFSQQTYYALVTGQTNTYDLTVLGPDPLAGIAPIAWHTYNGGQTVTIFDTDPSNGVSAPDLAWYGSQYKDGYTDVYVKPGSGNNISRIYAFGDGTDTQDMGVLVQGNDALGGFYDFRTNHAVGQWGALYSEGSVNKWYMPNGVSGADVQGWTPPVGPFNGDFDGDGRDDLGFLTNGNLNSGYADGDWTANTIIGGRAANTLYFGEYGGDFMAGTSGNLQWYQPMTGDVNISGQADYTRFHADQTGDFAAGSFGQAWWDQDHDGDVDAGDYAAFTRHLGAQNGDFSAGSTGTAWWDAGHDGNVDVDDYAVWLNHQGGQAGDTTVGGDLLRGTWSNPGDTAFDGTLDVGGDTNYIGANGEATGEMNFQGDLNRVYFNNPGGTAWDGLFNAPGPGPIYFGAVGDVLGELNLPRTVRCTVNGETQADVSVDGDADYLLFSNPGGTAFDGTLDVAGDTTYSGWRGSVSGNVNYGGDVWRVDWSGGSVAPDMIVGGYAHKVTGSNVGGTAFEGVLDILGPLGSATFNGQTSGTIQVGGTAGALDFHNWSGNALYDANVTVDGRTTSYRQYGTAYNSEVNLDGGVGSAYLNSGADPYALYHTPVSLGVNNGTLTIDGNRNTSAVNIEGTISRVNHQGNSFNSAFTVQNVGGTDATVSVQYYNQQGYANNSPQEINGSVGTYVHNGDAIGSDTSISGGCNTFSYFGGRDTSSIDANALASFFLWGLADAVLFDSPVTIGQTASRVTIVGDSYGSPFTVQNTGGAPADVSVNYYNQQGNATDSPTTIYGSGDTLITSGNRSGSPTSFQGSVMYSRNYGTWTNSCFTVQNVGSDPTDVTVNYFGHTGDAVDSNALFNTNVGTFVQNGGFENGDFYAGGHVDRAYFLEGALGGDHEIRFGVDYYTADSMEGVDVMVTGNSGTLYVPYGATDSSLDFGGDLTSFVGGPLDNTDIGISGNNNLFQTQGMNGSSVTVGGTGGRIYNTGEMLNSEVNFGDHTTFFRQYGYSDGATLNFSACLDYLRMFGGVANSAITVAGNMMQALFHNPGQLNVDDTTFHATNVDQFVSHGHFGPGAQAVLDSVPFYTCESDFLGTMTVNGDVGVFNVAGTFGGQLITQAGPGGAGNLGRLTVHTITDGDSNPATPALDIAGATTYVRAPLGISAPLIFGNGVGTLSAGPLTADVTVTNGNLTTAVFSNPGGDAVAGCTVDVQSGSSFVFRAVGNFSNASFIADTLRVVHVYDTISDLVSPGDNVIRARNPEDQFLVLEDAVFNVIDGGNNNVDFAGITALVG